jgi:disulfide bond formation protein DsbB
LTRKSLIQIAASGSAILLLGALAFEHLGGLAPCKLCLWQRWPHGAAVALGLVAAVVPATAVALLGALAAASSGVIAVYHTGVELAWWQGPAACSGGGGLGGLSGADLLSFDGPTGVVMCDEVAWAFAGLSMASWNAVLSFALALVWLAAARARPGP